MTQHATEDKDRSVQSRQAVLVAGAGIAGMAAASHLAALGFQVLLLDAAPTIGGSMHLLDHTFPTNSCGLCLMLPRQPAFCPTFECEADPQIHLLPFAELLRLEGEPGAFTALVRHKARLVDPNACNGCGDCAAVCPEPRPHDYEGRLAPMKAIYRPPGQRAVPDAWLIDTGACTRCGACVTACPTGAIDLQMQDREETLQAGALLLTPGFAPFDLRLKGEYGYGVYDNVLSAFEFERMVSLAGSSVARLHRPSDGQPPRNVAFVHCVGSRDPLAGAAHCSSACCMFTAKQVALAKLLDPDLEIAVFTMDLRPFGKDFDAYLDAVQALPGVSYRRTMPSSVHQLQQSRELLVTSVGENGRLAEEPFDLLVLATGFAPPTGMQQLARELGLDLNDFGFARTGSYHPTKTARPGIYVAGAFREPKDIPETVAEAAAAAAEAAAFLGTPGLPEPRGRYELRDVSDEEPRLGVFVCQCNGALSPLEPPDLVAWAQTLPGVASAALVPDGCSAAGQASIRQAIESEKLNRVVMAGCSHRLFATEFEAVMRGAGLDPRLMARVNLREQAVLPHRDNGAGLNAKAHSLVSMAAAQLRAMAGLQTYAGQDLETYADSRALVIGGGAAGMSAALQLATLGFPVDLVERETQLGGQWRQIRYQPETLLDLEASDPQAALAGLIQQVSTHPAIRLHLGAELQELAGSPGHYRARLGANGHDQVVETEPGTVIIATGGRPAATGEYLYGHHPNVLTQRELEEVLATGSLPAALAQPATRQAAVMIQCAGSREPQRPYCSRVCCTQAVKNALKLKALEPDLDVYVLYRDVRTYGFREALYQQARDADVVFLRFDFPAKPAVQARGDRLSVSLTEPVTGRTLNLEASLLVLSVGIEAAHGDALAHTLGVRLNPDGFFQEEHPKMKPLDLGRGLFVAGLAHSPRFLDEAIAHGQAAAMRAAAFLAQPVEERPSSVWVNERLCSFCGLCVDACPYQARVTNDDTRLADVDYALCQGCGVCAMVCPNKATQQKAFEHRQLLAALDAAVSDLAVA